MYMMDDVKARALEGFERTDPAIVSLRGGRSSMCSSRTMLEAFLESGEECISKPMAEDDLSRMLYNLRHYRKRHENDFGEVGISGRGGRLILYRIDMVDGRKGFEA